MGGKGRERQRKRDGEKMCVRERETSFPALVIGSSLKNLKY